MSFNLGENFPDSPLFFCHGYWSPELSETLGFCGVPLEAQILYCYLLQFEYMCWHFNLKMYSRQALAPLLRIGSTSSFHSSSPFESCFSWCLHALGRCFRKFRLRMVADSMGSVLYLRWLGFAGALMPHLCLLNMVAFRILSQWNLVDTCG